MRNQLNVSSDERSVRLKQSHYCQAFKANCRTYREYIRLKGRGGGSGASPLSRVTGSPEACAVRGIGGVCGSP